eukprot:gene9886-10043_t
MADIDPTNDPTVVRDDTPFPDPQLYFKVFDSERDEPDSKYREDVFKLYERWEKKYGRKWPENGMNTEDLVWLYNEAYKDEEDQQQQPGKAKIKTYPREQQDYEGQFATATEDAVEAAAAALPKDPKARAAAIKQAQEDMEQVLAVLEIQLPARLKQVVTGGYWQLLAVAGGCFVAPAKVKVKGWQCCADSGAGNGHQW